MSRLAPILRKTARLLWSQALLRRFVLLLAVIVLLLPCYAGLLWLAALPSGDAVMQHLEQADAHGYFDEEYPRLLQFRGMDMFTECIALDMSAQLRPTFQDILTMKFGGACEHLRASLQSGDFGGVPYPRYWHGYQVFLRPLIALMSYADVRLLTALTTAVLFIGLYAAARLRLGEAYAVALVASFLTAGTINVFTLVSHAALFWIIQLAAIALLLRRKSAPPILGFGILGSLDAFLSFLNMGSLSLSFPLLCLCLALWHDGEETPRILADGLLCSVAWSIGLLFTWVAKWGLAWAFLPPLDLFGATVEHYFLHSFSAFGSATARDFGKTMWLLWVPVYAWLAWRMYRRRLRVPRGLLVVLLPAIMPFVWIMILPGQSGIHHSSFVSIILWTPLAALLFLLLAMPAKTVTVRRPSATAATATFDPAEDACHD
ncbi:hypothetical protein dsx2_2048 [Desulfovibrio sp. X2]|uniref:hypothetical protein n=1 Tax=Desulfovibrio sp. X2 TaxID=941449 RepID=UPI0003589F2F|nr:hypothetical protein [Desulfovibrio sp. X2]EPR43938.1 hypothetical protein dsx2_2048 [Desulfovibrio sp. X2]